MKKKVQTDPDLSPWVGYPEGDGPAWVDRYAPLIREDIRVAECSQAQLSVVVVAWRSSDFVVDALDSIQRSCREWGGRCEVILIDNGGLDEAWQEILCRVHRAVRMVGNVQLCRARNLGAALATAPVIVFLDDDGLVEPGHLAAAHRWMEDPSVTAIRGRIVYKEHRYFTTLAEHYDRGDDPVPDALVTEGNMAIRRSSFLAAGGFNETLSGNEGVDLTFRLKQRDPEARTLYVPDVVLRHDFVNGWAKFRLKFSRYAHIDNALTQLDPGLSAFLAEHSNTKRPERSLRLDERFARWFLRSIKRKLQRKARRMQAQG